MGMIELGSTAVTGDWRLLDKSSLYPDSVFLAVDFIGTKKALGSDAEWKLKDGSAATFGPPPSICVIMG